MNYHELKLILQLSPVEFERHRSLFVQQNPAADSYAFLDYLYQQSLISKGDYLQAKVENSIQLEDELKLGEDLQFPGLLLQEVLGDADVGKIFIARDVALHRPVALKKLDSKHASSKEATQFVREALITAQLSHPNIVPVYAVSKAADGSWVYTMKLIRGKKLSTVLASSCTAYRERRTSAAMPLDKRLRIFLKICDAIAYAHARGVVHGSLQPSKILLGAFSEVYVLDWSKALLVNDKGGDQEIAEPHLQYSAPEYWMTTGQVMTAQSDQYVLGLILQEIVTLQAAIPSGTPDDLLRRAKLGKVALVQHVSPRVAVPAELTAVIAKATQNNPSHRYGSVVELTAEIQRFLRHERVIALQDTVLRKIQRWNYRNQTKAVLLFAVVVFLGLGSNLINMHIQQQENQREQIQQKRQAEAMRREQRAMGELLTAVASRAHQIDQQFLHYLGFLRAVHAVAQSSLTNPEVQSREFYLSANFTPEDLQYSGFYHKKISLNFPVIKLAPDVSLEKHHKQIYQLARLQPILQQVMLQSIVEEAVFWSSSTRQSYLLEKGAPIVWAMVATETGIHCSYPGKGGYDKNYDPRVRPWYVQTHAKQGPGCKVPYLDKMGQGLLLPCTMPIMDEQQQQIGVAALEFQLHSMSEKLLSLSSIPAIEDSFLVNEEGNVLIQSTQQAPSLDSSGKLKLSEFPSDEVVGHIQEQRSGYSLAKDKLIVYYRMPALGWYYVIRGDKEQLLHMAY